MVGLLFAISIGVGVSNSGVISNSESEANLLAAPSVQTVFSPAFALLGFCLGVPIGGAIGYLWDHTGLVGAFGIIMVSLLGGFVGLMAASLFGAVTRVSMSSTAVSVEHGASDGVMIGGAALGTFLGILCVWWFNPVKETTELHRLPV
jgi:hypothetical protein